MRSTVFKTCVCVGFDRCFVRLLRYIGYVRREVSKKRIKKQRRTSTSHNRTVPVPCVCIHSRTVKRCATQSKLNNAVLFINKLSARQVYNEYDSNEAKPSRHNIQHRLFAPPHSHTIFVNNLYGFMECKRRIFFGRN